MKLSKFWFTFQITIRDPHPPGALMGCGVTAFDEDDAVCILKDKVFCSYLFPEIKESIIDVDVSKLDRSHVLPNMADPTQRGVWFPLGYS